ncbi:hypothetical protein [Xanthomonas phage JGB6]|nr:hypothetical protein [Xanthomonas phage JGB6]
MDNVLRVFEKTQRKLIVLSARLREAAAQNEAKAQAALDKAKAQSAEAERATTPPIVCSI